MRRWFTEPVEFTLLAVFSGAPAEALEFLREWTMLGGDTNLGVTHVGDGPALSGALVFLADPLPDYSLFRYWLTNPGWTIFYRRSTGESAPKPASGYYLPWEWEEETSEPQPGNPVLVAPDGNSIPLTRGFSNAFECLQAKFVTAAPLKARVAPRAAAGGPVEIRLVNEGSRPANPAYELARLQDHILKLQTQAEALAWWCAEAEFDVEMRIYVEDRRPIEFGPQRWFEDSRGKVGLLRRWFASVPTAWIDEFKHTRVEVEELLALHLVIPKQFGHAAAAQLPETPWRLRLDRNWLRKQKKVFVSEGYALRPAPPTGDNPVITELLANALWNGPANRGTDILVVLRSAESGEHRFSVPDASFQPLATRTSDLNFEVGIKWHDLPETRPDYIATAICGAADQVVTQVIGQANAMRAALDAIWTGTRSDIELYRQQVSQALAEIGELEGLLSRVERWHQEITGFQVGQRDVWTTFVTEVLNRHLQLPPSHVDKPSWLRDLVGIEGMVLKLGPEQTQERARVSEMLEGLAHAIHPGNQPPPQQALPPNEDYPEQF